MISQPLLAEHSWPLNIKRFEGLIQRANKLLTNELGNVELVYELRLACFGDNPAGILARVG
jgi:hypothetical protein